MNSEFWKSRRVLVTGHTGFKGSWLCMWLRELGADVAGYALEPPTDPSLYELARANEDVASTIGDVDDLDSLAALIDAFAPEVLLHMAAQSVVLDSYTDPVETYRTNVMGTVHVLDAVRTAGKPCVVVNVTTDKVYANTGLSTPYGEADRLGGKDPYSNSKACSELVTSAYRNSFFPLESLAEHGVSMSTARAGNVIGGGDWTPWQLIPDIAAAFSRGRPVELRNPEATRPWQHVLDCLRGYLTLAEKLHAEPEAYSGEWNFGPPEGDVHSVRYIVEAFARRWQVNEPWIGDEKSYAPEEPVLQLDSTKSVRELGWRPAFAIDTAVGWAADWYRLHFDGGDPRALCLDQIREYNLLIGV